MDLAQEYAAQVTAAVPDLPGPELLPERLARACVAVLPVDGAGLSAFFAADRRLPLGASDPHSATAERLQFTVGEGPCISAHASGQTVFADAQSLHARWPVFADALVARTPIRGVISLPLHGALTGLGALDLYVLRPDDLRVLSLTDALTVCAALSDCFATAMAGEPRREGGPSWLDAPAATRRALVWQAIGILNAGLELPSPDALALLRAWAYSHDSDLDDVAAAVVERRLPVEALSLATDPTR
ncbi:ANTAR domain-containing protein [Modestobacter versicolor]|uniref:ANTAR domain-containing protein n=1 Tax=Modestobacter versicolor TaxID=429133 RepID=A0A839Y3D4_9ACTN|nr:ANTAR domain-containing protein [Modestobacter versicolor]MBB3677249.1 hypothetical protein [Modestobacter versicolor]